MDYQIKELMEQGLSRIEIFGQLKKQSSNQMRLAQKIATFEPGSPSARTSLINRVLLVLCLLQASFGIWVIHSNVVPMDEEFGWQGIVATFILTIFYFFNHFPVVSIVGVSLATAGGVLAYLVKTRLFPHVGFMDVKKGESGTYILE